MTNSIIPKIAYIPLEYHMSVEDFLEVWKDMEMEEEPTQEEYEEELQTQKAKSEGKVKQPDLAKGDVMAVQQEEVEQLEERHMTDAEMDKREDIVKSMKKGMQGFKDRYGDRAKDVMYATATKQAMKD